jgi:hypothetical protein
MVSDRKELSLTKKVHRHAHSTENNPVFLCSPEKKPNIMDLASEKCPDFID